MSYDGWKSYARAPLAARASVALIITLAFLAGPAMLDGWGYHHLYYVNVYDHDWARMLRVMGFWPTWIVVGLVIWFNERDSDRAPAKRRANFVNWIPAASGVLCEVVKLLVRRERPDVDAGSWVFRPWSEHTFSTAGLATPSSHTMVAFAAATIMARLFPRARWVFYLLAVGCAATRVMARAHYVSDVTFGAILGWAIAWGIWMQFKPTTIPAVQSVA